MESGRLLDDAVDLEWQVDRAGDDGEPFSPDARSPQAISLDEAQDGISEGDRQHCLGFDVHHLGGRIQHRLADAKIRIDVQEVEQVFGHVLDVYVALQDEDKADCCQHGEYALQRLDGSDGPQPSAVGISLGCG